MTHCPPLIYALSMLAAWPLAAKDAPPEKDERFGVMTHFAHGWEPALIPAVGRSGVAGVRDELYWREIETQKNTFAFPAAYEATMSSLADHMLAPLIVLSFENGLYDGGATPHTDEGIAAYARYGVEVLRHYGSQIKAVEVWNEYNGGFVRGPAERDRGTNYLRLLETTYREMKSVRPDVIVVGGATAGVPLPYWEKLLAGGALDFMDALSVHPYRYDSPPEGIETDIEELASLVARYNNGRAKPIWVSEIGWPIRASTGPGDIAVDELVQAQFLVRAYALLFAANVERVYWYLFRDHQDHAMGLVRGDAQVTARPSFAAMSAMAQQLRGARLIGREKTLPDLYSIQFRRSNGEDVRVMWSLPARNVMVSGVTAVVDMLGKSIDFNGTLQLSASPVFVSGPMTGLPESTSTVVADARRGFSGAQGQNGWSYGFRTGEGDFVPLSSFAADDWRFAWRGSEPYLSVSSTDQHPSHLNNAPVAAVRRWQSDRTGVLRITGAFRGGKNGGDGIGVAIAVDGHRRFRKMIGGGPGNPVAEHFDFTQPVQVGTTIDFAVDPGPGANIDCDGTAVTVALSMTSR